MSPKGQMAEQERRIQLYCYARPVSDDRYMAVCLTLNLVVQARTQRQAIHKLHELIKAYILDAVQKNELDQFVPRRAPVRFYTEYILVRTICTVAKLATFRPSFCAFTDRHKIPAHA